MILNNLLNTIRAGYNHYIAKSNVWYLEGLIIRSIDGISNNGYFNATSMMRSITQVIGLSDAENPINYPGISTKIAIGTGDSAPEADDYTLTDYILSETAPTSSMLPNEDGNFTLAALITNGTGEEKTFSEIGLCCVINQFQTAASSYSSNKPVMVTRELLDTPITLGAGESATVTATFKWV